MMADKEKPEDYWNRNIGEWGKFYLNLSHTDEEMNAPRWLSFIYRHTVMPIEARLMSRRYRLTMEFISRFVREGMVVVDVGCGTGVFTVELLKRGALVKAVDHALQALELTRALVEKTVPERSDAAEYLLMDVTTQPLPASDIVLAMGVTPYVEDLAAFYGNILPTTRILYCLILDPDHWANRVRRLIPALNVRNLHWFDQSLTDSLLAHHGWRLMERRPFASGYLDTAERVPRGSDVSRGITTPGGG
ncbi:MAG: Mg-protoporphyrin IX methyl transferase [Deltaproteobacteria bacterium ADurb.BinA179]|nr:MAG: Mg-protoporphyrin IX methyl transferase [Deltaproteobacteria bacterium ADurb.BinA179]